MEHFTLFLADSSGCTACNLFWFCLSHFHIERAAVSCEKPFKNACTIPAEDQMAAGENFTGYQQKIVAHLAAAESGGN